MLEELLQTEVVKSYKAVVERKTYIYGMYQHSGSFTQDEKEELERLNELERELIAIPEVIQYRLITERSSSNTIYNESSDDHSYDGYPNLTIDQLKREIEVMSNTLGGRKYIDVASRYVTVCCQADKGFLTEQDKKEIAFLRSYLNYLKIAPGSGRYYDLVTTLDNRLKKDSKNKVLSK